MPNELKLMFAEELRIHDVNALARTCRAMNELLTRFMYSRFRKSRTKQRRPYFLLAVDDGNLAAVERFLDVGALMGITDTVHFLLPTALHSCAHFGHVEILELLIDRGIEVPYNIRVDNCIMETPLHLAARRSNVRLVELLLDLGSDPNVPNRLGHRPVHYAASNSNAATVRCLLEAGKNVEIADYDRRTPLHFAAMHARTEIVKVLLEMGANPSPFEIGRAHV